MSYNGSGVFTINTTGQPVVTGTTISSTVFNTLTADLATGLTTALTKDGQSTPTANIKLGAFKITNLGAATLASDAARLDQIQGGGAFTFVTAAGTDTITGTTSPTLTAYATGNQFSFLVANTNTGAVTINVDSLGAKAITRTGTTALIAGDMVAGQVVEIIYDGTQFQLVNGNSFTNLKVSGTLAVTGVATLVAPVLGTPTSVTLTNATGLPPAGVVGTAAILAANTFTAAQEWSTGSNIASAATINLDTATGNRVHITGTTTITAVTLTRGPRTVIFDGILTLTHHATNNNLPGAANITTAAGDRAIYESDGTTVYCVSYIKVSGAAVVGGSSIVQYPQLIKSADYTLVLADAGYQIFHPATDTAARTFTIPANASVAFDIGTVLVFVNPVGSQQVTVAITTDTLVDMRGVTGSKIVYANNILTAMKITSTRWMCYFADNDPAIKQFLAIAHTTTPFVTVYPFSSAGFGNKYTNPATLPANAGYGVAFSPAGTEIAVVHPNTPFVTAYPWSSAGFGTKFADPSSVPTAQGWGVAFSPDGRAIAVAHDNSPYVTVYRWSSAGFGTSYSNPATVPTGNAKGVAFSPNGDAIAIAHSTSPFVSVYPWSSAGFGTKFSNPATLPAGTGKGVAFSPAGTEIVIAHGSGSNVTAYPWSSAGFGTKFADPATTPGTDGFSVAFSPAGTELAVGHESTPRITVYRWSSAGFGTSYSNPATVPTNDGNGVAFSTSGTELAVAHELGSFVAVYPWSSAGFGTKFSDPATLPAGTGRGAACSQL